MNTAERIVELDNKLDQVILARGRRMEFEYEPDDKRSGGVGAVLGGAGAAAAGYGGYRYNKSLNKRTKYNRAVKSMQSGGMAKGKTGGPTSKGGLIKQDISDNMKKAADSKAGKKARAYGRLAKRKGKGTMGLLKGLRKKVIGYSEPTPEDLMEFMYDSSGKGYGDMARGQAKSKKNTKTARSKRMAMANAKLMKKKFNALPRNKKLAVIAALGGGAGAASYAASR
jgi:hypothetical protein